VAEPQQLFGGEPVLSGWSEDVEEDGVFDCVGAVDEVWGDDEGIAGVEDLLLDGAVFTEVEEDGALEDAGDLLVGVGVAGGDAAGFELDAGEHDLRSGDELAGEQGNGVFGGDFSPGSELVGWRRRSGRHGSRIYWAEKYVGRFRGEFTLLPVPIPALKLVS